MAIKLKLGNMLVESGGWYLTKEAYEFYNENDLDEILGFLQDGGSKEEFIEAIKEEGDFDDDDIEEFVKCFVDSENYVRPMFDSPLYIGEGVCKDGNYVVYDTETEDEISVDFDKATVEVHTEAWYDHEVEIEEWFEANPEMEAKADKMVEGTDKDYKDVAHELGCPWKNETNKKYSPYTLIIEHIYRGEYEGELPESVKSLDDVDMSKFKFDIYMVTEDTEELIGTDVEYDGEDIYMGCGGSEGKGSEIYTVAS